MVYFSIILGISILIAMIYMALNKKSTLAIRIASIIALAIMVLSIIICLFIVFSDNRAPVDESVIIVGAAPEIIEKSSANMMVLLPVILLLFGLLSLIIYQSMKEHRKNTSKLQESVKPAW